jgi:hypothetical protein
VEPSVGGAEEDDLAQALERLAAVVAEDLLQPGLQDQPTLAVAYEEELAVLGGEAVSDVLVQALGDVVEVGDAITRIEDAVEGLGGVWESEPIEGRDHDRLLGHEGEERVEAGFVSVDAVDEDCQRLAGCRCFWW